MQCSGDACQPGCRHDRERRIAAESHNCAGAEIEHLLQRGRDPDEDDAQRKHAPRDRTSGEGRSRDGCDLSSGEGVTVIVAAPIGHYDDAASAPHQLARKRLGREKVAPGSSRSEHKGAAHRSISSGRVGRCRVRPSANPSVRATANKDEPPYEIKGSVMPLAGRTLSDTPMLMKACKPMTRARPAPASCAKGSCDLEARSRSRIVTTPNRIAIRMQSAIPNSSPATAKMKSVCASGRRYLIVPAPGPTPTTPPASNALSARPV